LPVTVKVGHKNEPLSLVRRPHVTGRDSGGKYAVTESDEPADNSVQAPPNESRTILADEEPCSEFGQDAEALEPEAAAGSVEPFAADVGSADVLAGPPCAENIDALKVCRSDLSDIFVPPGVGPVLLEHSAAKRILLDLPEHGPEAGHLEAPLQSADAREEGADGEGPHRRALRAMRRAAS
jgi:hypothetical protein